MNKMINKIIKSVVCAILVVSIFANYNNVKAMDLGITFSEQFPDPILAGLVASNAGKTVDSNIDSDDVSADILNIPSLGITDVTGIEIFSNLVMLDLHNNNLSFLPNKIGELSNLQVLRLEGNILTSLPESIGNLSLLTTLGLDSNQLTSLPDSIVNLTRLNELLISSNKLTALPNNIGNMTGIHRIDAFNNLLTAIPDSIGNLSNLYFIRLSSNQITQLPASFYNLVNLRQLILEYNQITRIDESIENLSGLTLLNMFDNRLTSIPDNIVKFPNLLFLDLGRNRIAKLPDPIGNLSSLRILSINVNQLTALPDSIGNLAALEELNVSFNELTSLPSTLINMNKSLKIDITRNLLPDTARDMLISNGFTNVRQALSPTISLAFIDPLTANFTVYSEKDLNNILASNILKTDFLISPNHIFMFDGVIDNNDQSVNIASYMTNGFVTEDVVLKAKIRASGTGLYLNNSPRAVTSDYATLTLKSAEFTASFDLNGGLGDIPVSQTVKAGVKLSSVISLPSKEGFKFVGWNTKSDGSGTRWDFSNDFMLDSDLILYAEWEALPKEYEVSFDLNGATGTLPSSFKVKEGELIPAVSDVPVRRGYSFIGWSIGFDDSAIPWDFTKDLMPSNNIVLYALWQFDGRFDKTYKLTFDLNGAMGEQLPSKDIVEGQKISIAIDAPLRDGYKFIGWSTTADGKGKIWNFAIDVMPSSDLVLYATWEKVPTIPGINEKPNINANKPNIGKLIQTGTTNYTYYLLLILLLLSVFANKKRSLK